MPHAPSNFAWLWTTSGSSTRILTTSHTFCQSRFQHPTPSKPEHSPHKHNIPQYGAKVQYTNSPDTSPALNLANKKRVQEVLGTLLYYTRAINSTMLPAIGSIATQQTNPTKKTMEAITQLLNYCASNPNTTVRYQKSDMVLHADSDASYLSSPKGRSRAAGYFYLSKNPTNPNKAPTETEPLPTHNSAITVTSKILREVLSSAAEAELAVLF